MSSSEDEWVTPTKPTLGGKKRSRQEGESNLKGFANAFATIIDRPATAGGVDLLDTPAAAPIEAGDASSKTGKSAPKRLVVGHDPNPVVSLEEEAGEGEFKAMAQRGVVKLFRAVAMHKKREIEYEASKGIGVTKSGQIRRRRPKAIVSADTTPSEKTRTMSSFLDALKKAKTPPSTSTQ